jgi:hypothetical protein
MQSIVEARRRHINRSGRWSEQKKTPAVQGRGDTRNHYFQTLILADLRGQNNA